MVVVLSNAGVQNPIIPSFEVVGKAFNGSPSHIGGTGSKTGSVLLIGSTVTVISSEIVCPQISLMVTV